MRKLESKRKKVALELQKLEGRDEGFRIETGLWETLANVSIKRNHPVYQDMLRDKEEAALKKMERLEKILSEGGQNSK